MKKKKMKTKKSEPARASVRARERVGARECLGQPAVRLLLRCLRLRQIPAPSAGNGARGAVRARARAGRVWPRGRVKS